MNDNIENLKLKDLIIIERKDRKEKEADTFINADQSVPKFVYQAGSDRIYITQWITLDFELQLMNYLSYKELDCIFGIREATRAVNRKSEDVLLVVIAKNLEVYEGDGKEALSPKLNGLIFECVSHNVPFTFSLSKRQMTKLFRKKSGISAVTVLKPEMNEFTKILNLCNFLKEEWKKAFMSYIIETNYCNESPLWICAYYGYSQLIDDCVFTNEQWIEQVDSKRGRTPLLIAAERRHFYFIKRLITLCPKLDVTAKTFEGLNILSIICEYVDAPNIISLLLDQIPQSMRSNWINQTSFANESCIHVICKYGRHRSLNEMRNYAPDFFSMKNSQRNSPIMLCVIHEQITILQWMKSNLSIADHSIVSFWCKEYDYQEGIKLFE